MRRVQRTTLHRNGNHARVKEYTAILTRIFDEWVSRVDGEGYSSAGLISTMDAAAQQEFPRSFALGRHQAYPKPRPSPSPSLADRITLNRHYLQNSLAPAIDDRVNQWRLDKKSDPLSEALTRSFRSRVQMYGGAAWTITEAGYKAGIAEARSDLAKRLHGAIMADDSEDETEQPGDHALAIALGLTVVGLLLLLRAGRSRAGISTPRGTAPTGMSPVTTDQQVMVDQPGALDASGIRVGTEYDAEADACDPCSANAEGGEDGDGIYWDEDPPLPGDDCDGMNRCRCSLNTVTDDSIAA